MTWTKHGYGALGALQLASIILAWIVIGIGFVAFATASSCCLVVFSILSILSALFVLAIVIFCFIGTQTRYWKDWEGCTGDYDGYLSVWNSVDNYLQAVDSLLCSESCPCYFNETSTQLYVSNSTTAPYFNLWRKANRTINAKRFQDCPETVKSQAKNLYLSTNAYFNHTFRDDWFMKYYKHIEKKFKCTGFCSTVYFNGQTGTNAKIVKYLFSDYTKEIPEHFGCLSSMMDWLRKTLNAFAACGLFLFVFLLLLMILAIMLLAAGSEGSKGFKEKQSQKEKEEQLKQKKIDQKNKEAEERRKVLLQQKNEAEEERRRLRETENKKLRANPKPAEEKEEPKKLKASQVSKKSVEPEQKKERSEIVEIANTSYIPPKEQKEETDFIFHPSISKQ